MITNKEFAAILQVALWKQEGMNELEIRQLLAQIVRRGIISAGIKLQEYLSSLKLVSYPSQVNEQKLKEISEDFE